MAKFILTFPKCSIVGERDEPKIRKFLKPSEEKIHFLFRGAETQMKSKLSGMAKFILTFPGAA